MPAIATIVAKVVFYIVQVVAWLIFIKIANVAINTVKNLVLRHKGANAVA